MDSSGGDTIMPNIYVLALVVVFWLVLVILDRSEPD